MRLKILLMTTALMSAACQQTASTANQTVTQTPKPIATAANIAAPNKPKIKLFDGKGVVTKINLELVSVELDHEEIKGLMPKMIMEFYVKEKTELERLKVGDTVDFVLEDDAGAERIIKIEKR